MAKPQTIHLQRKDQLEMLFENGFSFLTHNDIPLEDHNEVYYSGPVKVGGQHFDVVFDTGSYNLVLEKKGCSDCKGTDFYDPDASSTSHRVGTDTVELGYGSADLEAEVYTDTACLADSCATDYKFYPFIEEQGLDLDGIMGMGPQHSTLFYTLSSQGQIPENRFQFALGKTGQVSAITIGGLDPEFFQDINNIVYAPLINEDYWTTQLVNVEFGSKKIYHDWTTQAIVDTGTTVLVMEDTDYNQFLDLFTAANPSYYNYQSSGTYVADSKCSKAESIYITLKGAGKFEVPWDQYLQQFGDDTEGYQCVVRVASSGFAGFYILGDVFIRNQVCIFDYDKKAVGFSPIKDVDSLPHLKAEEEEPVPEQKKEEKDIFDKMADAGRQISGDVQDIFNKMKDITDDFGEQVKNFF
eukprot:TRINITY_DN21638_c0_g1_i2.p2 TRINITY_DN21638_c0_g1~~TRINITY_DN21638_c0_g1_i2.p2  ORF type:complete len:423 (-),score=67.26 TRINITY_DN21638_c0_g1_i2:36-1268(-)